MGTMTASPRGLVPFLALPLLLFLDSSPVAAQLPPAIQADRLLVRAEREIQDGEYAAAAAALEQILELQAEHGMEVPDAFWFKRGQVAREAGLYERAIKSVTRYLEVAGQEGEHYAAALELLDAAEQATEALKRAEWDASERMQHADTQADIAALKEKFANVDDVRATPIAGLYELRFGYNLAYVDASGQFGFLGSGDLQDLMNGQNFSEQRRSEARRGLMDSLDEWDTVDFLPDATEHELLVFTDVDCGFCRRMHQQMAEYHRLGIGVRYAAFPRSGPDSDTWTTMQSIWCADDPLTAMSRAKAGGYTPERLCDSVSVQRHFELGQQIGLTGTPALVTPDGRMIPGYVPPARLAAILSEPTG